MGRTQFTSKEIGNVQRNDLDITTTGEAVIRKAVAGTNISFSSTGVDAGTGDVTINNTYSYTLAIGNAITSATQGSIFFAGASGVLAQNNANLFWDDTNSLLRLTSTTEQLRIRYNASNYLSITVGSAGSTTLALTGTTPTFTFSQNINVPTQAYGVGWSGSTQAPTKGDIYTKLQSMGGGGGGVATSIQTGASLPASPTLGDVYMLSTGRSFESTATGVWSEKVLADSTGSSANQILGMNGANSLFEMKSLVAGANITINHAANSITIIAGSTAMVTLSDASTVDIASNLTAGTQHFKLVTSSSRTLGAPGTGYDGQVITIRWDNTSGSTITTNLTTGSVGAFRFGSDITAIDATVSGKSDYITCIYDSVDNRWDVVAFVKGF